MSCGLPREVLKWILSLDLSYAVKNPKRDFANGFLYAEILSRYYPGDVQMHSFENVASMERKKSNWALLEKVIKRKRIPIERSQIEAVMAAEGDVAVEVLQAIFNFIHSPSYEASKAQGGPAPSPDRSAAAQARDRGYEASTSGQPDYVPLPAVYDQQQYGQVPGAMYFGGGGAGGGRSPAAVIGGGGGVADNIATQQRGNPGMYQQVSMGLQQQQQQQQQLMNGYGVYAQAQPQYSDPGSVFPGGGYSYGYGYSAPQAGLAAAGYAAQLQQQQQQQQQQQHAPAPSQGRSVSPGRGGARPQPQQAAAATAPAASPAMAAMPVAAGGGYAAAYALAYAEQMRQRAALAGYGPEQQQLVYQQALYQYQQQAAAAALGVAVTAESQSGPAQGGQNSPEREGLPYSRKPRPVDFKPYDIKDFEEKEYNVKAGRGYWQLGKLGPDLETEELQAKREAKERVKKLAEQVREENARRANSRVKQRPGDPAPGTGAGGGGAGGGGGGGSNGAGSSSPAPQVSREKEKELSARERALQFAKNIPKPELKPKKQPAASQSGEATEGPPALSELELLEKQHQERQQQVDKIRAELARIL
ncbi:hypothetical protein Vafri_12544 [Volvox africanus]|uniref:Calponin-homology (CH) domain-containing protein n=1 Tax=Volvox africanus TaxID=51714 RepID=A0A8J4BEY7_9CHLO|nr:hypothetical protein Vafri_12544 [Volvox africanus]